MDVEPGETKPAATVSEVVQELAHTGRKLRLIIICTGLAIILLLGFFSLVATFVPQILIPAAARE